MANRLYLYRYNKADERLITAVKKHKAADPMTATLIDGYFRSKKLIAPHDMRSKTDLPSNDVISSNVHQRTTTHPTGSMYKRKRSNRKRFSLATRSKGYKRYAKHVRLPKKGKKSRRRTSKYGKGFVRKVINAMNPVKIYDHSNGITYKYPSNEKSYWIDPHYEVADTRTTAADKGLSQTDRLKAIYLTLFGTTITQGMKFMVSQAYESFRMTNMSNSPMNIKIYFLTCVSRNPAAPAQYINYLELGDTDEYPGLAGTALCSNDATAGHLECFDSTSKQISIRDFKELGQHWKTTNVRKLVLQPNQNIKVVVTQPRKMYTEDYTVSAHVLGSKRVLIRCDGDLTRDNGVSTVTRDIGDVAGYAFSKQSLVIQQRSITRLSKLDSVQNSRYIDIVSSGAASVKNLGSAPYYIGEYFTGAPQAAEN